VQGRTGVDRFSSSVYRETCLPEPLTPRLIICWSTGWSTTVFSLAEWASYVTRVPTSALMS